MTTNKNRSCFKYPKRTEKRKEIKDQTNKHINSY